MTDTPATVPGRPGPVATPYDAPDLAPGAGEARTPHDDAAETPRADKRGGSPLGGWGRPWRWIAGLFGALILLIVIFLWLFQWDWLRGPIARYASGQIHRSVRIDGHLKVHLLTWTPTVRVEGIKVGQPDWGASQGLKGDMAQVEIFTVAVKLMPLFAGHVDVPLFDVEKPNLVLFQDAKGRANWDFSDPDKKTTGKPFKLPPIQKFVIADGRLKVTSLQRQLSFTGTINTTERASSSNQESFKLVGAGTLNRKPFHMNVAGGPLINIHHDQPYPFDLDVSAGDTRVTAKGTVPHPFDFGRLDLQVSMQGSNLNDLYYLTKIVLPTTPPYRIAGHLTRDGKIYDFTNASGRIGGSDIEGHLRADTTNKRFLLSGALRSRLLDFADLASLFGAPGKSKAATPAQKAQTAAATAGDGRLLPDATLNAEQLRAMDADVTYKATAVKAPGLPLKDVALGVKLNDGVLVLNPIRLGFPQGSLNGNARLDGRPANPITDVDLKLTDVELGNFVAAGKDGSPKPLEGKLAARAKLHGVGNSVHKAASTADGQFTAYIPGGHVRQAFAELLGVDASAGLLQLLRKDQGQADIRCAVADFRVRDGIMQAQRIAIDTTIVVVNGKGTINLGDESLGLQFDGKPTKFRLIRLLAPVTIGGHLKSPAFGVKPGGAIAQLGVAAAAGVVLGPVAAIVPFLDLGGKKNIDCASVAATANAGPAAVPNTQAVRRARAQQAAKPVK